MKKTESNKQKEVTAATFKRLAKALRVRARNHQNGVAAAVKRKDLEMAHWEREKADIFKALASDLDHEAENLRSMR